MLPFQVVNDNGSPIDAHFEIDGQDIVFHSRGGGATGANVRNRDYGPALRVLLARLLASPFKIIDAFVDSSRMQSAPEHQRSMLAGTMIPSTVDEIYSLFTRRMKEIRPENSKGDPGGAMKKIRIRTNSASAEALIAVLKCKEVDKDFRSTERLPADMLSKVGEQHIYNAVQALLSGEAKAAFDDSIKFDVLLDDGTRLPPKAVFGIAATEALSMEVLPKHFSGGVGTICFRIIESCGYTIVPKGEAEPAQKVPKSVVQTDEDREFVEGQQKRYEHLRRERKQGASKAKKVAFKLQHGLLFCEKCKMKPIEVYGEELGEACIEVHHTKPVAEMKEGDKTRLDDLQCLCASCHRVVHRELRLNDQRASSIERLHKSVTFPPSNS